MNNKKNSTKIVLFGIFFLALAFRVFNLGNQSLWVDEVIIYKQLQAENISQLIRGVMIAESGRFGTLYHCILFVWCKIFGFSEIALRLPSALFGFLTVVVVYFLGREIFNKRVGVFASAILALSPLNIFYSQEARMYSLWIMLATISILFFYRALKYNKNREWIGFFVFSVLSLLTYTNTIFILATEGIFLLVFIREYKKEFVKYALCVVFALIIFSPILLTLLKNVNSIKIGSERQTSFFTLWYTFWVFNVGFTLGPPLLEIRRGIAEYGIFQTAKLIFLKYSVMFVFFFSVYVFIFIYSLIKIKKYKDRKKVAFLELLLAIPILSALLISLSSRSLVYNVRYVLISYIAYLLILSYGILKMGKFPKKIVIGVLVFSSLLSLCNFYFNPKYAKIDMRKITNYLNSAMRNKDKCLIFTESAKDLLNYYDKNEKLTQVYCAGYGEKAEEIIPRIQEAKKIFFITTDRMLPYDTNTLREVKNYILNNYDNSAIISFSNARIEIFQMK